MSIVTLKKKTLAQYQTQNGMVSNKKEVSYCAGTCRSGRVDHPAYLDVNQTFTGLSTFTTLPQSSTIPYVSNELVNKTYADNVFGTSYNLNLTGNAIFTFGTYYKNAIVSIASNGSYTVTIPSPATPILNGSTQIYVNSSSYTITLSINTNLFRGKYGSGLGTLLLPANTFVELYSNGTDWEVNVRSAENQIYSLELTGNSSIASNFQYANAELHITTNSGTGNYNLTLPECSATLAKNARYKIYCDNHIRSTATPFGVTLTVTTSSFKGQYQDNVGAQTTLTIPPNSWVEMYNNGTSWNVIALSSTGWVNRVVVSATNIFVLSRPFSRTYLLSLSGLTGGNFIVRFPTPTASDCNQPITFRLFRPQSGSLYVDGGNTTTPHTNPIYIPDSIVPIGFTANKGMTGANQYGFTAQVMQTAVAGTGTIRLAGGSSTAVILSVSTNCTVTYLQTITLNTTPPSTVIIGAREQFTSGLYSVGLIDSSGLALGWGGNGGDYPFTGGDVFNWFVGN